MWLQVSPFAEHPQQLRPAALGVVEGQLGGALDPLHRESRTEIRDFELTHEPLVEGVVCIDIGRRQSTRRFEVIETYMDQGVSGAKGGGGWTG